MDEGAKFTPKKVTRWCTAKKCCVKNCPSTIKKDRNLTFHKLPTTTNADGTKSRFASINNEVLREKWITNLSLKKETLRPQSVICSRHFHHSDYYPINKHDKNRKNIKRLKASAVPTKNLPPKDQQTDYDMQGTNTAQTNATPPRKLATKSTTTKRRSPLSQSDTSKKYKPINATIAEDIQVASPSHLDEGIYPLEASFTVDTQQENEENIQQCGGKRYVDCGIQCNLYLENRVSCEVQTYVPLHMRSVPTVDLDEVNLQPVKQDSTFCDLVKTEKMLLQLTGIPSFSLFHKLVKYYTELKPDSEKGSLKAIDKILLLFMKLRLNVTFSVLSIFFNVTQPTCKRVFEEALEVTEIMLETAVYWPSKSEIMSNLPYCFKQFPKVRVVLDATEIPTTKRRRCIVCKCKTYSHYKGCHTCKFLIGVTPAGLISFVSKAFGGRASDKIIFEHSNLIEKFEPHVDDIMVDKGVLIRNQCEQHNIGLIHPPFMKKKFKRLPKSLAKRNYSIAAARVHVERAIERIKKFKFLKDVMPWGMVKYASAAMKIVCGLVNLSSPILAKKRFTKPIS